MVFTVLWMMIVHTKIVKRQLYEIAVFHSPNHTQQESVLRQGDEMEGSEECRGSHNSTHEFDEHHVYDEVKHKAKIDNYTAGRTDSEKTADLELFDDMVHSSHPSHDTNSELDTKLSRTHLEIDIIRNNHMDVGGGIKTSIGQDENTEPVVAKKQTEEMRCSDEHLYDSADQMDKGQTRKPAALTRIGQDNHKCTNREADGIKHVHQSPETGSQVNPEMLIGHLSTTVQDINSQSADCDPTLYNCQFDDPMYESTPHSGANLKAAATKNSMKADVIEPQEESMQSNTELVRNYSGDVESYGDAPQHSDPTDLVPMDNHVTADSQDEADRKLTSIYDMFDDPTYGECHAGSNKLTKNIH